jgi:hypothetical protein
MLVSYDFLQDIVSASNVMERRMVCGKVQNL